MFRTSRRARWRAPVVTAAAAVVALLCSAAIVEADWSPTNRTYAVNGGAGVDIAADGSVWAVSAFDNAVVKYSSRGDRLLTIGGFGTEPGRFNLPSALTIAPDGDVYVTDVGGDRVERFAADGTYVRSYGGAPTLSNPRGVAVSAEGDVIVGDAATGVHRFDRNGALVRSYPAIGQGFAVALDAHGDIWASDFGGSRDTVRKLDGTTGAVLVTIGGFGQPTDIDVDATGNVHVADFNSSTVRTLDGNGTLLEVSRPIANLNAIAVDDDGRLISSGLGGVQLSLPDPVEIAAHIGQSGDPVVEATFATATAGESVTTIDFDGDGFDGLAAHTFTPILADHYGELGVQLIGLDARSVGSEPWASSPPIGAWPTGFGTGVAQPYSFVFDHPVASFGFFAHDIEGQIIATVHLADGRREFFTVPTKGSVDGRFVGVTADDDNITRIDFDSTDYHIIDDVRFGRIHEPVSDSTGPVVSVESPQDGQTVVRNAPLTLQYGCTDDGGSGLASCAGPVPSGSALDTSVAGSFPLLIEAVDGAGNRTATTVTYRVVAASFRATSVTPSSRPQGGTGQVLTVTGDGFVTGSTARATGGGVTITSAVVVSETTMQLTVDVAAGAALGAKSIVVTKPGGPSVTCTGCLTIVARPAIATVSPSARPQGASHATIRVSGSGFYPGATASFAGAGVMVHGVTYIDSGSLDLDVSVAPTASTGAHALTVVNPDSGAATRANGLSVTAAPTVTAVNPAGLRPGRSADVTISGSGFAADFVSAHGTVSFGDGITVGSITRTSATRLRVNVAVAAGAGPGSRTIAIVNPDGGRASCTTCATVVADPVISTATPTAAPRGTAGITFTLGGSGFRPGAVVTIAGGGVTVANTTVDAATITSSITIGAGATLGPRDVMVTNPDTGTVTCTGCLVVNARPTITAISPATAPRGTAGSTVVISGTGFQPGATVTVGGTGVRTAITSLTATAITVRLTVEAIAAVGTRTVTVTNPDTGSATRASGLRIT